MLPLSRIRQFANIVFLLTICQPLTFAQGTKADYERSATWRKRTREKVFRSRVSPKWINGGPSFWYQLKTGPDSHKFVIVKPLEGIREAAFDHQLLADQLAAQSGDPVTPTSLPITELSFVKSEIRFRALGKQWTYKDGKLSVRLAKNEKEKSTAEVLSRIKPSGNSTEDTQIRFVNQTQQLVEVYWINSGGRPVKYGTIEPEKELDLHTYVSHTWLITIGDEWKAGFRATAGDCVAYITNSSSVEPMQRRSRKRRDSRANREVSPDGKWQANIQDHNVVLTNLETKTEVELTTIGNDRDRFESPFYWSPDSSKLIVMQELQGESRTIYHIESSPNDRLQPKLHEIRYAKPGDKLDIKRPRLFHISTDDSSQAPHEIKISNEQLYENPWSITRCRWSRDSKRFDFLYNARGHQTVRLIGLDGSSGKASAIINEQSATFIDYAYKLYCRYTDANEIIWMSEQDGWNHLYRFDHDGKLLNQITKGRWVVRNIEEVDEENGQIWFRASGVFPNQDPYFIHLGRINFDGENLTWLTQSNGNHQWNFDPTGQFFIDKWSRVDQAPVHDLRSLKDGSLVCELESANVDSLMDTGWNAPEPFVAKGRDGKTDIYGIIVRPSNFDKTKKYPVIEKIYAGPHGSHVPKDFGRTGSTEELAEIGFIVVQIDGMGTSNRSKAFHDVCWKNLIDAGFPDRIAWLRAAAEKYPQLDLNRVGIFGGSAGGQNALAALLTHGDFYKVAAADCGCHDNRMDKVWWNELWMGWPIGPHYEEQSNVTLAHQLQGKLLLTVGELDRNVDPASTMQVVDALIKADKDFDLIVVPGAGHGVGERPYAKRRRTDFFVRYLMNVEPRR